LIVIKVSLASVLKA